MVGFSSSHQRTDVRRADGQDPSGLRALSRLQVSLWRILDEAIVPQFLPLLALLAYAITVSRHPWSHDDWRALVVVSGAGAAILGTTFWLRQRTLSRSLAAAGSGV